MAAQKGKSYRIVGMLGGLSFGELPNQKYLVKKVW